MTPPTIKAMVQAIPRSLGAYGPVLREIEEALQSPQCSLSAIGDAIQKDPDLTARLLRLANSPFYGFASRLSTVAEAVGLVGIQQIQDMIVASSVLEQFKGVPDDLVSKVSFWRHSLAVGIAARLLAMEHRLPKPDKFFVAGLLHDVGRLVLFSQAAEWAQKVFELYQGERILLRDAERKILGYDHQQIAAELLQSWSYPPCWCRRWRFTTRRKTASPRRTPPSSTSPTTSSTPWASAVRASISSRRSPKKPAPRWVSARKRSRALWRPWTTRFLSWRRRF